MHTVLWYFVLVCHPQIITTVSVHPPGAPQVAAAKSGDCTFEVDECNWANPSPRDRLDEMDWVRSVAADNRYPARDHTIGTTQGTSVNSKLLIFYTSTIKGIAKILNSVLYKPYIWNG